MCEQLGNIVKVASKITGEQQLFFSDIFWQQIHPLFVAVRSF